MSDTPRSAALRRIERRERKQRAILDAALEIVADEGIDGLTMPALAARMDVAVGGLYRTFRSKERIVVELQARAVDQLWRRLGARWRSVRDAPVADDVRTLATLVASLDGTLQLEADDPLHHGLLARLWARPPEEELAGWLVDRAQPFVDAMLTRLMAAVSAGALEPVEPFATLTWWGASVFASQAVPRVVRLPPDAVVDTLLRGAGAEPSVLDQARKLVVEP